MFFVDKILNKITMYRLALYYLIFLVIAAIGVSFFGRLPYSPVGILFSFVFITIVCLVVNAVCAALYKVPANPESVYITAFILVLIIAPIQSIGDTHFWSLAIWASCLSIASKYVLALGKKHIFNPVAIALVITAFGLGLSANWWVATLPMLPFVAIGGFLVVRKLQRFDLVAGFALAALAVLLTFHPAVVTIWKTLAETPFIFFACIMLTEPLTTPPTRRSRIFYGVLVGLMFAPFVHVGDIYSTPELALVVGNIFSYIASPKKKYILKLREKKLIALHTYHFIFDEVGTSKIKFKPGQYLEWTLVSPESAQPFATLFKRRLLGIFQYDSRGARRYFTIASSPTEEGVGVGVKFYDPPSEFKKSMASLEVGDSIMAGNLAGDFTLPKDTQQRIVFLAGGIGITPFRSMIRELLDRNEQRPVRLIYANKTVDDIAYKDIFDEAKKRLGIKTVYTLTDTDAVPAGWHGYRGKVDEAMIKKEVPGYTSCLFYLSGPRSMVSAYEQVLINMDVPIQQIKKDFFPGFV